MDVTHRVEQALDRALTRSAAPGAPPKLAEAMRYAVFPAGARVRPRLCLAVAAACGDDDPAASESAAIAIELLHCASLIHDDLPCFDDAATRRGKPSVHKAFGEPLAVLAGDALIVLAFQTLARGAAGSPERVPELIGVVGRSVGAPFGIVAGQAWECEPDVPLAQYQRSKTGALFAAASIAGAVAAGAEPATWGALGEWLGEAYQVADDIRDVAGSAEDLGKPVGQDVANGRPSAAREMGLDGAVKHLETLVAKAIASVPDCPHSDALRDLIHAESRRFLPAGIALRTA